MRRTSSRSPMRRRRWSSMRCSPRSSRARRRIAHRVTFGDATDWHVRDGALFRADRRAFDVADLPLTGPHNALNVCAALTALEAAGEDALGALPQRAHVPAAAASIAGCSASAMDRTGSTTASRRRRRRRSKRWRASAGAMSPCSSADTIAASTGARSPKPCRRRRRMRSSRWVRTARASPECCAKPAAHYRLRNRHGSCDEAVGAARQITPSGGVDPAVARRAELRSVSRLRRARTRVRQARRVRCGRVGDVIAGLGIA